MPVVHAIAPKVARFELRYNIPENVIMNVFHARSTASSWDSATMDAVEAAFLNWFTTTAYQYNNDTLNLFEIVATDLSSLSGLRKVYPIQPPVDGNLSSGLLPGNATFAIKANIGNRGKGLNGRVFWPSLSTNQVTNQEVNKTNADELVTALQTLRTAIASVSGCDGLCIPHFTVNKVRVPVADNTLVVSYSYTDLYIDSQRDRLPFHKKHKKPKITTP